MKKIKETLSKILTKQNLFVLVFTVIALHPIIELDYLAYDWLSSIGLPRITTIIDYLILPLIVLLTFILFEKNKKKVLIIFGIYTIIFGVYFILHCSNADYLSTHLHLTSNFVFNISDEVIYCLTLLLPLVYIYVFNFASLTEGTFKKIVITLSAVTAIPIFVSNIFTFGMSTYDGYTIGNIFSWFSLPFDNELLHPRYYACKFFFEEGNTTGILMFMVLPFVYYYIYKSENRKEKILLSILVFVHSISMIMLSTRIATYGAAIIPAVMLAIYLVLLLLKTERLKKIYIVFLVLMTIISSLIIPYSPAYQNQQMDAQDYEFIRRENYQLEEARGYADDGEDLEEYSEEWLGFYTYMFEAYVFLMNVTPPVYYQEYYDYHVDPKFWVDFIFDYDLEERVSGRQLETIFTQYKYNKLTTGQKILGMGYGTFMRGSIVIERDFIQQFYTLGYLGFVLMLFPWILLVAYLGIKLLLGIKKKKFTYFNILLMMSVCIGIGSGFISGHTLDQLTTSMFMSLCAAFLMQNLKERNTNGKETC